MHRRMIAMVREVYEAERAAAPAGWTALPAPATPQRTIRPDTINQIRSIHGLRDSMRTAQPSFSAFSEAVPTAMRTGTSDSSERKLMLDYAPLEKIA